MQDQNDADKIELMYQLYEQMMFREAKAILHDDYSAEDAVHEAFLRLIRLRDRIRDPASAQTRVYVRKTLRSAAIDLYRIRRRDQENTCVNTDFESVPVDIADSAEAENVIETLPPKYAAVLRCRILYGLSVGETAAVLKINEANVRKRHERALKLLRKKWDTPGSLHKI